LVRGKGEAKLVLLRHLAPLTVDAIIHSLPLDSRVGVTPAMTSLFTTIQVGVEKPRMTYERGDVAFLAGGGLLCVFLKTVKSERPLNPVGKIEAGIEVFDSVRPGDVVRVTLHQAESSSEAKVTVTAPDSEKAAAVQPPE
jgi:hypothetical protein